MLEAQDIARLKEIFVTRQECDNTVSEIEKKLANDSTELALIKQSKTTLAAVIVAIVGAIMALILK